MQFDISSTIANHLTREILLTRDDEGEEQASRDRVSQRAYEIYERRGRADGSDLEDWLKAEQELKHEP